MNEIYDKLKKFGFIPGESDIKCLTCGLVYALMDKTATSCKRCARLKLKEAAAG